MINIPQLTPEMFLEGNFTITQPRALSFSNKRYYTFIDGIVTADIQNMCKILIYPFEEIFTRSNLVALHHYGELIVRGKSFSFMRASDVLSLIHEGEFDKNEVLHDLCQLLSKHNEDQLEIKVNVYNYLAEIGFVSIEFEDNESLEDIANRLMK